MAKVKVNDSTSAPKKIRPGLTPESREQQLISLAVDLVEQRLLNGTATSQETTHFLKLAAPETKLKREILERERDLLVAKTEQIKAQQRLDEKIDKAIEAMKRYQGVRGEDNDD